MFYQSASLSAFFFAVFWSGVRQLVDENGTQIPDFDVQREFHHADIQHTGSLWQWLQDAKQQSDKAGVVHAEGCQGRQGNQPTEQLSSCRARSLVGEIYSYVEYCVSNNVVIVALSGLPYCVAFLVRILSKKDRRVPVKRERRYKDPERPPVFYKPEKSPVSIDKDRGVTLDVSLLKKDNRQVEETIKQRVLELEVMAKTVEYLQRTCRNQECQLQKRGSELEEMARTVEYLQRPGGTKAWVGLMNRVYHSTFLGVPNMGYYQLHVPMDRQERPCSGSVEDLRDDSDSSHTPSDTELDWDEWDGSASGCGRSGRDKNRTGHGMIA